MYELLKQRYLLGKCTEAKLHTRAETWLTPEECAQLYTELGLSTGGETSE